MVNNISSYAACFGQPRQSEIIISMEQMYQLVSKIIYKDEKAQKELQTIFDKIDETIINHKTVTVIASSQQPESIIMIIKSENDVEVLKKRVERYISSISV